MPEFKKGFELIEKAAHDGAETVRRVQMFAQPRKETESKTEVNVSKIIEDALEFTKIRWKNEAESKNKKVTVKKELSPALFISGVESELREVFTNLINNAIDSLSDDGEIRIRTSKDTNHVVIKVEDTGCGISETIKDNIFDPFFTTKGPRSTGMGLSLSYGIINRHQGTIVVESAKGKGSSFTIMFPISGGMGEKKVGEENSIPITRKQKRARILIVDDEEEVRQILFEVLNDNGHEIKTASDGIQGIAMCKESNFDMVFTDLGMPGMNGWQVAEEVKKKNRKTPVALITGWTVKLKQGELKNKGVDFLVSKPFKIDQILQLVQTIQDEGNA
jgi:CheY-like chemotaxis protein/anti-sigma regulatory factor (Ser/Thr protein kinase)